MHDIKFIVNNLEEVKVKTGYRNIEYNFDRLIELYNMHKECIYELGELRSEQRRLGKLMIISGDKKKSSEE